MFYSSHISGKISLSKIYIQYILILHFAQFYRIPFVAAVVNQKFFLTFVWLKNDFFSLAVAITRNVFSVSLPALLTIRILLNNFEGLVQMRLNLCCFGLNVGLVLT